MSEFMMAVECRRCHKIWHVNQGIPDITCDCHLYCPDGTKPSDCSVTRYDYTGGLGWPTGLRTKPPDDFDDVLHLTYYCSTHDRYYKKVPVLIPCDWEKWFSRRAPKKFRMSQGQY